MTDRSFDLIDEKVGAAVLMQYLPHIEIIVSRQSSVRHRET